MTAAAAAAVAQVCLDWATAKTGPMLERLADSQSDSHRRATFGVPRDGCAIGTGAGELGACSRPLATLPANRAQSIKGEPLICSSSWPFFSFSSLSSLFLQLAPGGCSAARRESPFARD